MIRKNLDFHRLSQQLLAEVHGVSTRSVREWTSWGMPRRPDGLYSAPETIEWRCQHTDLAGRATREARQAGEPAELALLAVGHELGALDKTMRRLKIL